ncbi:MBL fold metallo-hydrolase [Candidatus Uhrbacteria bacterium]|nr:MBL fold metallo-hydrolase [Candidatus Uhrbacteria bacterium]
MFDVGQGDAIFIDAPDMQVLIDGGPSDAVLEKLSSVLPPWDRSIDLVVATHPHADHILGLDAVLGRYAVGALVDTGTPYDTAAAEGFERLGGAAATVAQAGMSWELGNGATLEVVWPEVPVTDAVDNVHDGNVVLLLTYGETTMLLTGDAETEHEEAFALDLPHIDVLKVGHHGSDTSTGMTLVNLTSPDYAIISVGAENDYGHPSPLVVDRLARSGAAVLRTDLDGDIRVLTEGDEPHVTTFPE